MEIYLGGAALRDFGARLRTDYQISGYPRTQVLGHWEDSAFFLLEDRLGLLTITLPLDFWGRSREEIGENMAALRCRLGKRTELDLGDGFLYRCCLTEAGAEQWSGAVLCSQTLLLTGVRHRERLWAKGTGSLCLYNPGTFPKTACRIILEEARVSGDVPVVLTLRQNGREYLVWRLTGAGFEGKQLILDGEEKRNLYGGGNVPEMEWREYPYLLPGENTLTVTGMERPQVTLTLIPTYL